MRADEGIRSGWAKSPLAILSCLMIPLLVLGFRFDWRFGAGLAAIALILPVGYFTISTARTKERYRCRLELLSEFTAGLSEGAEVTEDLANYVKATVIQLGGVAGYLMVANERDEDLLRLEAAYSKERSLQCPQLMRSGEGLTGFAFGRRQPIAVHHRARSRPYEVDEIAIANRAAMSVPIANSTPCGTSKDRSSPKPVGTLTVVGRAFDGEDMSFLISVASIISLALDRRRARSNGQSDVLSTVRQIVFELESRFESTQGHSGRVRDLSLLIAERLGLSDDDLDALAVGAMLHDIGKVGLPDELLQKRGSLTDDETIQLQKYPIVGYEICKSLPIGEGSLAIIRHHREHVDGGGFPDQLEVASLSPLARIVAVADAFDVLASSRAGRGNLKPDKAFTEIGRVAGSQFDPIVVEALRELLGSRKLIDMYASQPSRSAATASSSGTAASGWAA